VTAVDANVTVLTVAIPVSACVCLDSKEVDLAGRSCSASLHVQRKNSQTGQVDVMLVGGFRLGYGQFLQIIAVLFAWFVLKPGGRQIVIGKLSGTEDGGK